MTTQLTQDWKFPLQASNFTGYIPLPGDKEPAGTVLRCITLSKVPCTQEVAMQYGISRVYFGVVRIMKRGWVNAPYKKPKTNPKTGAPSVTIKDKEGPPTKALFEETQYLGRDAMRVYNYARANAASDKVKTFFEFSLELKN